MTAEKEKGFDFWEKKLNKCQYVVAPMVDQSELAWRLLSRRYGSQLCYTPMYHSGVFVKDHQYRRDALQSCKEDRPLIIQFCSNDPETLLAAAKLAEDHCEAIDLNLGCPQAIARRGHYGAFLQEDWELLHKMVNLCHKELKVPITCKIRVLETIEKTIEYAKMLEKAGCQLLTVHGRTREMKGRVTGIANWEYVKAVKEAVNIPVFSNGNIQYLSDVKRCLEETGVDGVMTAEGNLHNPALFAGINPPVWQMCEEYLELVDQYPCHLSYTRGHLFKLLHHALHLHHDIREKVSKATSCQELLEAVEDLKIQCQEKMNDENFDARKGLYGELPLPYWYCQPYVRPNPKEALENRGKKQVLKRHIIIEELVAEKGLSKKKIKRRLKYPNRDFDRARHEFKICNDQTCPNPRGRKCSYNMCRACCKKNSSAQIIDCPGHKHFFTTCDSWDNSSAEKDKTSASSESKTLTDIDKSANTDIIKNANYKDTVNNGADIDTVKIAVETDTVLCEPCWLEKDYSSVTVSDSSAETAENGVIEQNLPETDRPIHVPIQSS